MLPLCDHIKNQYYTESVNEAEPGIIISKLQRRGKILKGTPYFLHIPNAILPYAAF